MPKEKVTFIVVSLFLFLFVMTPQSVFASDVSSELTPPDGIEITKENFFELYETAISYDSDQDGWLSEFEIEHAETLYITHKIKNLQGLQHFTSVTTIYIDDFNGKTLTIPDECKNVSKLYIEPTNSSVKIDAPNVTQIVISSVNTEQIDSSRKTITSNLYGPSKGTVKKVDLSTCKSAVYIAVCIENISNVILPETGNQLKVLDLYYLNIKTINLSNCNKLQCIYIVGCEKLSKLDTSGMINLASAYIHFTPKLVNIDFSSNKKLKAVYTDDFTNASLPKSKKTTWYQGMTANEVFEISSELREKYNCCYISTSQMFYDHQYYDAGLYDNNYYEGKKIKISKSNFPSFYKTLKESSYDYNQDGWLSQFEIDNVKNLTIEESTSNLTGIEKLTSLKKLILAKYTSSTLKIQHPTLDNIMLEPYTKKITVNAPTIKQLYIGLISISSDGWISNWHSGTTVTTKVDVSKCKALNSLSVGIETVSSLTLPTDTKNLAILNINRLKIKTINLSSYVNLQYLCCFYCDNLSSLDLSNNKKLIGLWFTQSKNSKIRKLDLSNLTALEELNTYGDSTLKVTLAKDAEVNWSKLYNTGVYKIENRVKVRYSLTD